MTDRLDDIVAKLRDFANARDWGQFHDPKNLAMALASEAGELLAELRWIASSDSDAWVLEHDNRHRLAMEAADVGIALLLLCDRAGVDLVNAMAEKIELNTKNYPLNLSKGKHSRSNE